MSHVFFTVPLYSANGRKCRTSPIITAVLRPCWSDWGKRRRCYSAIYSVFAGVLKQSIHCVGILLYPIATLPYRRRVPPQQIDLRAIFTGAEISLQTITYRCSVGVFPAQLATNLGVSRYPLPPENAASAIREQRFCHRVITRNA